MTKPGLRQFGVLAPGDLERHPVWIGRHGAKAGRVDGFCRRRKSEIELER
jgi:hypothetical protein